jgi:tetratricopeptide (TPR) repeat protein
VIFSLLAAAAATLPAATPERARYESCVALARTSPANAVVAAQGWRIEGGGVAARQCEGLAYAAQAKWLEAATAFENGAALAMSQGDVRAADLLLQAGNAALAGSDAARAIKSLDAALATGVLAGEQAGEAHLDRGRAHAALGHTPEARADLDQAQKLVPADPLAWLLSATLARRANDLPRAKADIAQATKLAGDDSSVALEGGNIAHVAGDLAAARTAWERAVRLQPTSAAAKAAAQNLAQSEQ